METKGKYYTLFSTQAKRYLEDGEKTENPKKGLFGFGREGKAPPFPPIPGLFRPKQD